MNKHAAYKINQDHWNRLPGGIIDLESANVGIEWRLHRVIADFANPALNYIQVIQRDTEDFPAPVVHPQNNGSASAVCHGGQLIGEVIPFWTLYLATADIDAFEFQHRILAELNAMLQIAVYHDTSRQRIPILLAWKSPSMEITHLTAIVVIQAEGTTRPPPSRVRIRLLG